MQALVEKPPRERPSASRLSRSAEEPLFGRTSGLLVGPDGAAVEERHTQLNAIAVLRQLKQALPDTMMAPSVEGLCRHPPWPQMRRNGAPLRAVDMPPDDRLDGAPQ